MKKRVVLFTIIALTFAPAIAVQNGGLIDPTTRGQTRPLSPGGFVGPSGDKTSVKQAKTLSDGTRVTLTGKIEQRIGGEHYLFRDGTGSVSVDIDDKRWNGQTITPQDTVEIQGKVDKGWSSVEIDVKRISKVK